MSKVGGIVWWFGTDATLLDEELAGGKDDRVSHGVDHGLGDDMSVAKVTVFIVESVGLDIGESIEPVGGVRSVVQDGGIPLDLTGKEDMW